MAKHVFGSHAEVAHVWANNWQAVGHGRGHNVFFEGRTIYSYGRHFPIAHWVDENTIEFTDRSYSLSTAKHINLVRSALRAGVRIIAARYPGGNSRDNLEHALTQAKELEAKATRRRSEYRRDWDLKSAAEYIEGARYFAEKCGFDLPEEAEEAFAAIEQARAAEREEFDRRQRKLEKERNRVAKLAEIEWDKLKPIWRLSGVVPMALRQEALQRVLGHPQGSFNIHRLSIAMRLDGDEVVTSWGARFPVDHAIRAFRVIKGMWAKGSTWERSLGVGPRLGHYHLDKVAKDHVVAGCHTVTRAEIELMAETLEVANIQPLPMKETVNA